MNPYASPADDRSPGAKAPRRPAAWRTVLYGLLGAVLGYFLLSFLAALEPWPLYTVRSLVTGVTAMSRITQHPADLWTIRSLVFTCVIVGAALGMRLARRSGTSCSRTQLNTDVAASSDR
ncbi:MAG: hypothetical protein RIC55_11900 [Pirellulaceae bacterium]